MISSLENYIIVDTKDVLMICPMDKNQEVKEIAKDALKKFSKKKN